jgi:hypothetical protein
MTATVQPESKAPSRRALLAGALGGIGAWAASAVGRANPVRADDGDPVLLATTNTATNGTLVHNQVNNAIVFKGLSDGSGTGIVGESDAGTGVWGVSASASAVRGSSGSSHGVFGHSDTSTGIRGETASTAAAAKGVHGVVLSTSPGSLSAGVRGENNGTGGAGIGVHGSQAGSGWGIFGTTPAGLGVNGTSSSGTGVRGSSSSGAGLFGVSSNGFALQTEGRLKVSTSGVATIAAGSTSKTVNAGVNVTSGSFVLLTPKANIGGRALWFTTNPSGDTFRIRMSSSRSSNTKVAWLLLG